MSTGSGDGSGREPVGRPPAPATTSYAPVTHQEVFRRAAVRAGVTGLGLAVVALLAAWVTGPVARAGALWGAGAGALLTVITAAALAVPWDRYPLLASSGVMLSFAGKIVVMVGVVVLARPYRETMSGGWFLGSLALVLLAVTAVEIASLARGKAITVDPHGQDE